MLRVTDLDRSIKFYTEALGMTLIRTRDNPDNKYKLAFLGTVPLHLPLLEPLPLPLSVSLSACGLTDCQPAYWCFLHTTMSTNSVPF